MSEILSDGLKKLKFSPEEISVLLPKMERYIKEIILFNSAYNLTNTSDFDEIAVNHIFDSLSAVSQIRFLGEQLKKTAAPIKIGDIGSGGGLPGIPLAAALPSFDITLVERMDKRCAFLENVVAVLGLKNVTVLKSEAEKVPEESFDIAAFRAFRPLDKKIAKTLLNLTAENGFLAAYKAKKDSISEEMNAISAVVPEYKIVPLYVPFLTDTDGKAARSRNLVIVHKQ